LTGEGGITGGVAGAPAIGSAAIGRTVLRPAASGGRGVSLACSWPPASAGLSPRLGDDFGWSIETGGIGASFGSLSSPLTARATTGASARDIAASISRSAPISEGLPPGFSSRSSDGGFSSARRGPSISLMILLPLC
jgi:hypothetical protein